MFAQLGGSGVAGQGHDGASGYTNNGYNNCNGGGVERGLLEVMGHLHLDHV